MTAEAIENVEPGKKRGCPANVFRKDYRKHGRISYLEAADYLGLSVKTIQKYLCRKKNPIPTCCRVGPFRIDFLVLDKWARKELK